MTVIGRDTDGVTEISLEALSSIAITGKKLVSVGIEAPSSIGVRCSFYFEDNSVYVASGFAVGYEGEGPHGLHKAIRLFCPENMDSDFYKSGINRLAPGYWVWYPDQGFVKE